MKHKDIDLQKIVSEMTSMVQAKDKKMMKLVAEFQSLAHQLQPPEDVAPQPKIIDLSVLIDGIDCEFANGDSFACCTIKDSLVEITDDGMFATEADVFDMCRPRMNHWHAWQGGECPLPEGFDVDVMLRNSPEPQRIVPEKCRWTHCNGVTDIIAFRVIDKADGWQYPWQSEGGVK